MYLYDGPDDIANIDRELGDWCGYLFSPLTRYSPKTRLYADRKFAVDNGAFSSFNPRRFASLLERLKPFREQCLFVAVPDVVGSAIRTIEIFHHFHLPTWPKALVIQDGIESQHIPWQEITAVFIGGSTEFKQSKAVVDVIKAAKILGKWVHIGRVNGPDRWDKFDSLGADSCDGTGLARYSHMRSKVANRHPLFKEAV